MILYFYACLHSPNDSGSFANLGLQPDTVLKLKAELQARKDSGQSGFEL